MGKKALSSSKRPECWLDKLTEVFNLNQYIQYIQYIVNNVFIELKNLTVSRAKPLDPSPSHKNMIFIGSP